MDFIRNDLYELVSDSLYEACWTAKLPVHPSIGIKSFIKAVKQ
jgi:hypothetical protein